MSRTREESFAAIKEAFQKKDEALLKKGQLPMRSTERGFWGVSNLDDVHSFFLAKKFPSKTRFCDLGCGDGRVAMVASLFVEATGIEYDKELVEEGERLAKELGLDVELLREDIRDVDLSAFDALYMYADQRFDFLKNKLLRELRGTLYLYHDTYHPDFLEKGKIFWAGQIPIFSYTRKI